MFWHMEGQRGVLSQLQTVYRTEPRSRTHCSLIHMKSTFPWLQWSRHNRFNALCVYSSVLQGSSSRKDIIPLKHWCNPCIVHTTNSDSCIRHLEVIAHSTIHDWWVTEVKHYRIFHQDGFQTSALQAIFSGCTVLFTLSVFTPPFIQGVPVFIGGSLLKGCLTHNWQ